MEWILLIGGLLWVTIALEANYEKKHKIENDETTETIDMGD